MTSLIPGFEYDIFISYRQKDNKHDGWVTEFVDNLKGELESTFKEEISVYFDINPHDGLLETHDVDESLKYKLKCLVFIPIISRTYCDPRSFAWVHEFKAFIEQASEDRFGLKVKVPGGNVASRVLPVQIHDLDADDKMVIENELGGFMRGIEFIYKEPGVNRPLTPNDDEKKNLNNTLYKNQINKVANAIREIITGLKNPNTQGRVISKEQTEEGSTAPKRRILNIILGSLILLAVIAAGYFIISKLIKPAKQLEKSIAVLPFYNDSPDAENTYFINGVMDETLNDLQKIKDFSVVSRTSVEQYRDRNRPAIPKIARDLGVNYIVEGSGQKYGNNFRLRVQLIEAGKDRHLWAESYEKEIKETKDIFSIQTQIAQAIASELKATITPEERQMIETPYTSNMVAYEFYQKGREEHNKFGIDEINTNALIKAEQFYREALKNDSSFAQAYAGLALLYLQTNMYNIQSYFNKNYLDSALILANHALSINRKLPEAYYARATYYFITGDAEKSISDAELALRYNKNLWELYRASVWYYAANNDHYDLVKAIDNMNAAIKLNRGKDLPGLYWDIGSIYGPYAGFLDKANSYALEALKLDGDSAHYFRFAGYSAWQSEDFTNAITLYNNCLRIDSGYTETLFALGETYLFLGMKEESLKWYRKYLQRMEASGQLRAGGYHRIGYVYSINGFEKDADEMVDKQLKICEESMERKDYSTASMFSTYYDMAGVYALKGDKEKAYNYLRLWSKGRVCPLWWVVLVKHDPIFESIRNDNEFKQIVTDFESKYQAEHERVGKWMKEKGML
jgi:TolB-like protein